MKFLQDKSFIYMNKRDRFTNSQFKEGLENFFAYAALNPKRMKDGRIFCPCKKCGNRYLFSQEVVEEHIYANGFEPAYRTWTYHGEGLSDETENKETNRLPVHSDLNAHFMVEVKGSQYRSYVDMAGGDASLSTSWQVLHTKPDMPEKQIETQREHWENITETERLYSESNSEYPATQSMLHIDVKTNIMEHEFPNSAEKSYFFPLIGQAPSSRSRTSSSTSRTDFEYSQIAQRIHELQEQLDREREERTRMQEQINYLMQRQSQPSYDSQYEAFLTWQRAQREGGAGAGGSGFT